MHEVDRTGGKSQPLAKDKMPGGDREANRSHKVGTFLLLYAPCFLDISGLDHEVAEEVFLGVWQPKGGDTYVHITKLVHCL